MLKVFVTGLRGIPDVMGGVESHCEELYPRLQALSPDIEITIVGRVPYVGADTASVKGVRVKGVSAIPSNSLEAISSTFMAIAYAWRNKADVVHIHAIGPALTSGFARLLGLKVVVTHHGKDYNRGKWGRLARAALKRGEQSAIRWANRIICVSPSLRDDLDRSFPDAAGRTAYIPNGVPATDGSKSSVRERVDTLLDQHDLGDSDFVLAVARLVPEKGLHTLVEAVNRMPSPPKVLVVGGSEHRLEYAERLQEDAGEHVHFAGVQPREMVLELYRRAALFAMPSFHEGLPIAALEAANAGAPLLLSDIDANRDLGLPAANYFPVGDVDALADALQRDPENYRIDVHPIRRQFDWNRIAEDTLRVYEELVP